ncbi:hypothetical protein MW871_15155 [Flavobacterium sp. I-SCBP12n]|uniref:DUF6602 domain-containing protein n=1 Tax=Flavobacterium pygoscelis TaxID=2893176 RepID=A0A9X2BMN1_9FLAO|nr:DUF6602 domain-containing protein [Flavobacterium pygoscelis]MCK8143227.1 hypothetical protein [Flavobacterium pygoscelis]
MTETIFKQEEKAILLSVDKAKASSNNSQTIGRNGEIPMITFLNNYLPNTLKAVSGHFMSQNSIKSPQIDIMILDARYPLIGYNTDGTVLAMAHSVLYVIEIKTNCRKNDVSKTSQNFKNIGTLVDDIWKDEKLYWKKPMFLLLAYRIVPKINIIEEAYFDYCDPSNNHFDISILRTLDNEEMGNLIHFEPTDFDEIDTNNKLYVNKNNHLLMSISERTPLADLYYSLIQSCYLILENRNYSFGDIAEHFNEYLNWSTIRKKN